MISPNRRDFFVSAIASTAAWGRPGNVNAEPGFLEGPRLSYVQRGMMPNTVRDALPSVLRHVLVSKTNPERIGVKDYQAKLGSFQQGSQYFNLLKASVLSECIKQRSSVCSIPYIAQSSAFVAESADVVYLPMSILAYYLGRALPTRPKERQVKAYFKKKATIPLLLYPNVGQIPLFNTFDSHSGDVARIESMMDTDSLVRSFGPTGQALGNWVRVRLNRSLKDVQPLSFAEGPVNVGEKLFAVGYAHVTQTRKLQQGKPDSLGREVTTGVGSVIPFSQSVLAKGMNMKVARTRAAAEAINQVAFFHDVDTAPGMEGGPLLNDRAQVVGMVHVKKTAPTGANDVYLPNAGMSLRPVARAKAWFPSAALDDRNPFASGGEQGSRPRR